MPRKRGAATIMTSKHALRNLSKRSSDRNSGLPELQKAAIHVFGTEWNREVAIGVTTDRINNIPRRIKNSPAALSCSKRLEKLWADRSINPPEPPPDQWATWRYLLAKFG